MYELTLVELMQILDNIAEFNSNLDYLSADHLTHMQFAHPIEQQQENIPCLVFAIDTLFVTSLRGRAHDSYQIISSLTNNWEYISNILNNLNPNIQEGPEQVSTAANCFLNIVLYATGPAGRNHYSFAAKFLHWCNPENFPIMDRQARNAIRAFQDQRIHNVPEGDLIALNIATNGEQGIQNIKDDYEKWIRFYRNFINDNNDNQEIPDTLEQIFQGDINTQTGPFLQINTLLRILDKHFYIVGRQVN